MVDLVYVAFFDTSRIFVNMPNEYNCNRKLNELKEEIFSVYFQLA